jgi:chloramphenicol O-acetyltransferase type B
VLATLVKSLLRPLLTAYVKHQCASSGPRLTVNLFSTVTAKTYLGENVNFNGMSIGGGGKVSIGDNFHSGKHCTIITDFHNYEGNAIPYDNSIVSKDVIIEDNVWIGYGVIILGGVRIGEGAIIQAGSVVVSDIPACAIAGGHPARPFKMRNVEHYTSLKSQGRFF